MKIPRQALLFVVLALLSGGCATTSGPGQHSAATSAIQPPFAKNVIFFIGDGMSLDTITAARILEGQLRGESGEENLLAFEKLPNTALSKVYNTNQQVPDSAGTATAMMTGTKTLAGVIGVGPDTVRGECATAMENQLDSIVTLSEQRGLTTGIVSTARITHATPAAAYAHSADRNWENDGMVPPGQELCTDIASQLTAYNQGDGLDIVLGGGKAHFVPATEGGKREDNRNLIVEWSAMDPGRSTFIDTAAGLENAAANLSAARGDKVFGLFTDSHMSYEIERSKGATKEPSLTAMTLAALRFLGASDKGYFLYVEAGRIDHAHHEGKAGRALVETIELSNAVAATLKSISLDDTLVVVTADHGHTMTIGGYPTRGNPILGYVTENDTQGQPKPEAAINTEQRRYTTLSYANGPGYAAHQDPAVQQMDPGDPDYRQIAAYGLEWGESHSGADVVIYAAGPGADQFRGVIEQNRIFHLMQEAMQLYDRGDPDQSR